MYALYLSFSLLYGFYGNRDCKKKKNCIKIEWGIFFSHKLSLFWFHFLSLSPPFSESQGVWGAINIINQHNSTALSSAGRDEETRGNVNMPAWSSLNQWYISHILWMRSKGMERNEKETREEKRKMSRSGTVLSFPCRTTREQQVSKKWLRWRDRGVITRLSPTV